MASTTYHCVIVTLIKAPTGCPHYTTWFKLQVSKYFQIAWRCGAMLGRNLSAALEDQQGYRVPGAASALIQEGRHIDAIAVTATLRQPPRICAAYDIIYAATRMLGVIRISRSKRML